MARSKDRIPEWLDANEYPFTVLEFNTGAGFMSYVDEGAGEPIVFVHGTPVWSFLYRDLIKEFSKSNRCIAMDHLGFGLSDKSHDNLTPQVHAANLNALIRDLNLTDITLVVHDFGGPIGLGALLDEPERVKRLVILNTWCWETSGEKTARQVDRAVNSWLGKFLYLRLDFSVKVLMKKAFADRSKLTPEVHRQYIGPFPTANSRKGLLQIARSLVGSSKWYGSLHDKLSAFQDIPIQIIWGMKDDFISPKYLEIWKDIYPNAGVKELESGHFVQEESTEELIRTLRDFMSQG